jgi:hypothetical protein
LEYVALGFGAQRTDLDLGSHLRAELPILLGPSSATRERGTSAVGKAHAPQVSERVGLSIILFKLNQTDYGVPV